MARGWLEGDRVYLSTSVMETFILDKKERLSFIVPHQTHNIHVGERDRESERDTAVCAWLLLISPVSMSRLSYLFSVWTTATSPDSGTGCVVNPLCTSSFFSLDDWRRRFSLCCFLLFFFRLPTLHHHAPNGSKQFCSLVGFLHFPIMNHSLPITYLDSLIFVPFPRPTYTSYFTT